MRRLLFPLLGTVLAFLVLLKIAVPLYAAWKREVLMTRVASAKTEQEMVKRYASYMANNWRIGYEPMSPWRLLRQWLPKPFKPDKEATMFLARHGLCSDLVKASMWALRDRFPVAEHHIIAPHGAHSALSVQLMGGQWTFIDPYLGFMFRDDDDLMSLDDLVARLQDGGKFDDYAVRLRASANDSLYREITRAAHAREPEYLDVTIDLPLSGKAQWSLGKIDGKNDDVSSEGQKLGLTTHLFYIGPRYSQQFRFTYQVPDDGRTYTLAFRLIRTITSSQLPRFSLKPTIKGRTLTFHLPPEHRTLTVDSTHTNRGEWYGIDRIEARAGM